jgi:hypothetical protein
MIALPINPLAPVTMIIVLSSATTDFVPEGRGGVKGCSAEAFILRGGFVERRA